MNSEELYQSMVETFYHIRRVNDYLNQIVCKLLRRGLNHDYTKLESPEVEDFAIITSKIKSIEYGTEEYNNCKNELKDAIEHHYQHNTHHPEYFQNGIDDMNLVDIMEMFCDWKAASKRNKNGNFKKSIEICCEKYGVSEQLKKVFLNSMDIIK